MSPRSRASAVRTTALAGSVAVVALLPLFLTGGMAVQVSRDLAFGPVGLGLAVAVFRGAGAVTSMHLGRLTDHLGATRAIQLAALTAAVASLGIATTARTLSTLLGWLVLAGATVALAQPAANRLLLNRISPDRLGMAFGVKQSAPPAASLLAGAAVPLIAVTVGWRGATSWLPSQPWSCWDSSGRPRHASHAARTSQPAHGSLSETRGSS